MIEPSFDGARPLDVDMLTAREREVLALTSDGATNTEVAAKLGLTVHAVKFHLASIFRKLGVSNRTEAAALYFRYLSTTAARPRGSVN